MLSWRTRGSRRRGEVTAAGQQPARPRDDLQSNRQTGDPASSPAASPPRTPACRFDRRSWRRRARWDAAREASPTTAGASKCATWSRGRGSSRFPARAISAGKSASRVPSAAQRAIALSTGQQVNIAIPLTRASAIVGRDLRRVSVSPSPPLVSRCCGRRWCVIDGISSRWRMRHDGRHRRIPLHSLPAGEYFVTASARVAPPDSVVQTTLPPTFYPGTGGFRDRRRRCASRPGAETVADFPLVERSHRPSERLCRARPRPTGRMRFSVWRLTPASWRARLAPAE